MQKIPKTLLFLVFAVFLVAGSANATWYNFNYDTLYVGASSADIELYMEGITPPPGNVLLNKDTTTSDVEVLFGGDEYFGDDMYLTSGSGTTIEITFAERNITEVKFDWAGQGLSESSGFSAYAKYGDQEYTEFFYDAFAYDGTDKIYKGQGTTDYTRFDSPIQSLKFTNNDSSGYVALDNLWIENSIASVPEPATMLLLGSGLIGLAAVGRKKFRKS